MFSVIRLLLPALIPSWRFFKSVEPSPRVEWRRGDGEWQAFRPRPAQVSIWTMAGRLFWNPGWNEGLYAVSLSERLSLAPTAHTEDELFRLLVRAGIGAGPVQFRLLFVTCDSAEVTYQSAPRELAEIAS